MDRLGRRGRAGACRQTSRALRSPRLRVLVAERRNRPEVPSRNAAVSVVHRPPLPGFPRRRAAGHHHSAAAQTHRGQHRGLAAVARLPFFLRPRSFLGLEGLHHRPRDRHLTRRDGPELSPEPREHLADEPCWEPDDDRHARPPVPSDAASLDGLPRYERHDRFDLPDPK